MFIAFTGQQNNMGQNKQLNSRAGQKGGGVLCPPFSGTASEMVTWAGGWEAVGQEVRGPVPGEAGTAPGASKGLHI